MSKAKITNKNGYHCCPDGSVSVYFSFGKIVTGQVAEWAIADRAARRMFPKVEETKVTPPIETKKRTREKAANK